MSASTRLLDRPVAPRPTHPPAPRPHAVPQPQRPRATRSTRAQVRQLVVGLIALPLTVLPFVAYLSLTPEGRLVRDRALVALAPPMLPTLSAEDLAAIAAVAPRYEGAVMALAYHGIGSASDGEGGFVISAARFGEHLAALKAAGMHTVTAAQIADAFAGGQPLPPNAVMLSFDDGRADAMMFADPLLEQAGMSATMFVIAGAASKPGIYYASWDKIEDYARSGRWDIQSHTTAAHREQKADGGESLPVLTSRTEDESIDDFRARIREDLRDASGAIEAHVGRRPVAFAYPFGAYGGDRTNDPAIADIVREEVAALYGVAFQQDEQETIPLLTSEQDPLRLRRVEVQNWSGVELLQRIEQARRVGVAGDGADADARTAPSGADPSGQGLQLAQGPNGGSPTTTVPPGPGAASTRQGSAVTAPRAPATTAVAPAVATTIPTVVTTPPVTTPPPVTSAPTTTVPPITSPPTTRPPSTTVPPSTAPPTTVCPPAGKSGKCPGPTG